MTTSTTPDRLEEGHSHIYGGFDDIGLSIEHYNFRTEEALDWTQIFHQDSLEICLNLTGHGVISSGNKQINYSDSTAGYYMPKKNRLKAYRNAGMHHSFYTIKISAKHPHLSTRTLPLKKQLSQSIAPPQIMNGELLKLVPQLNQPPVPIKAQALWYESKILEILSHVLYPRQNELFCTRQKRLATERVTQVQRVLSFDLANPLDLKKLARTVGCSHYYLSRTFSQETGMTITRYLRELRIIHATKLLNEGKMNVTEVALEVGYNSLSHFSKAFREYTGACPGLYPHTIQGLPASDQNDG